MAEPAQRELLELPNPLPGQIELATDLFEGAGYTVEEPVSEQQDAVLATREPRDRTTQAVRDIDLLRHPHRVDGVLVLDEVAELRPILSHRLLQRHGGCHRQRHVDLIDRNAGLLGDLVGLGFTAQLGFEACLGASNGRQGVVQVDGDAHRPGLVGDSPSDCLADPPGGVGGDLDTSITC